MKLLEPLAPSPVRLATLLVVPLLLATSCATTSEAGQPGALVLATSQYDLHLLEGAVYQVVPGETTGTYQVREITSYHEFKDLYRVESARDLPAAPPERGIVLNGWVGLECVRKGFTCGSMPERGTEHPMLQLRAVFPGSER